MSEWIKYTGSDEQIAEIKNAKDGFVCRNSETDSGILSIKYGQLFSDQSEYPILNAMWKGSLKLFIDTNNTTHYLICNPHPLADMICQQARTGQEVWVLEPVVGTEEHPLWPRLLAEGISRENVGTAITENGIFCQYSTHTPYWHIPGTQYSFTRIGGYRANK